MNQDKKGFSLIELLIVVAIILIIAAIAIPNLMRARMAANESAAASTLRTIGTAEISYLAAYNLGFAPSLDALGPPAAGVQASVVNADLVDAVLAGQAAATPLAFTKGGYVYAYVAAPAACVPTVAGPNCTGFTITGIPQTVGSTGQSSFFTDQTAVIRRDTTGAAPTVASPVL
jgi:type IV pilus assembly protein PilA